MVPPNIPLHLRVVILTIVSVNKLFLRLAIATHHRLCAVGEYRAKKLWDELINDGQHPERLAVMGATSNEVVAPDMAAVGRSKPDARSVVQPQAAALWLPMRYFQPFTTPDALNPLGIHRPAFLPKQGGDAAVPIATVERGHRGPGMTEVADK